MIHKIIAFSIKNKLLIGLFTLGLIVTGIWSISRVPLDAVPDITNNQVQVITQAPNLGTEDIEQFVSYPIELAMSNLPGVEEIRSVSRFGLSLVTIVFKDDMGTYLPRQLVSEKLNEVKSEIPAGFGTPEIGPISTGLGEIYQYVLDVDSAYVDKYSSADLRTMQDWIIKRQMAMVPGVVEVNGFGGDIKQYEVAYNPDELKAIGISVSELFQALQANNQNTGGAYIEKNHYANFIRGEGLARSMEDIESIVIKTENNIPITIKDVAKVHYGKAIKYGAFTRNGQGEAVGGMILMLKGANSNDVIIAVKNRVEEIQKSLPKGVKIVPFLDRSKLISQTTGTVTQNLLEGALIVIFILVFLLGNWRGGLIVASTIPLSLLFAFILMNVFGVWANLMSLGAIDFGIIVDGAVIIVEGTVFILYEKLVKKQSINHESRDEIALKASSKMMNSAFFGQLIILIVFIPILALQGIEGKMFKPMALTFMFAMIGVMILCLTYVPMMTAWFLRVPKREKRSIGDRFINWLENLYTPILDKAIKKAKWLIGGALVLLGLSAFLFSRMGGEFIPKLDEGDMAFHVIMKAGTSLSETIEATTKVEKIVKKEFPEVEQILSRIGVADVPTDPMPMDIADVFVILKPKNEWTSASSKPELISKMKEELENVPGINFEFSQPIEMRFNELITGVREDVAIKLFGEDLEILASKAEEIGTIVAGIQGVADMKVEATDGLPQMTINYDRTKIAQYGLSIEDVNTNVQTAFAGATAGFIFEGEKRFDLVLRLDENHRKSIEDIKQLYITLPDGAQIPLNELANISYQPGPMQISRDNTNRRTYVGINVRGRDVKSLVEEIKLKIESEVDLPPGYYIRYGGAFENLERASERLTIVVPLALGLIFLFIFFALKSMKQTLMIYMAIPFAAIGGIVALWLRDMPFSISAGVGFIVLFGVAVLNGLVLISGWNELKEEHPEMELQERIREGAKRRIRPILLTALTDVLGFLPMAISSGAGAEVQQPLATVVIGGMLSATVLTLFILPILYRWLETKNTKMKVTPIIATCLFIIMIPSISNSQTREITTIDQAIEIGLNNNQELEIAEKNIAMYELAKKSALNIDKTDVDFQYGQINSINNDASFVINQKFAFPTVYAKQKQLAKMQHASSQTIFLITKNNLIKNIKQNWYELAYLLEQQELLIFQDSIYTRMFKASTLNYETGNSNYLEKINAETAIMEIENKLQKLESNIFIINANLNLLLNDSESLTFKPLKMETLQVSIKSIDNNPSIHNTQQQILIAEAEQKVATAKVLPDLSVGYFNQSMIGSINSDGNVSIGSDRFNGIQAGISVPLFFGSYRANVKTAKIKTEMAQVNADYYSAQLENQFITQRSYIDQLSNTISYYELKAIPNVELIIENAQKNFESGAIHYIEYSQSVNNALQIKFDYIKTINEFNQAVISLDNLAGQ